MAVLGALIGVRLLTELLDPSSYGELALGMTVATLVNQTILGPLGVGITRFYSPALERNELGDYLKATSSLVSSATVVTVFIMLLLIAGLLITGRTEWIVITAAAFIFAILSGYNSILSGIQNAARQRSVVALHQGMEPWARFLIAAGFVLLLGSTSAVAMFGYVAALIFVLGSQVWFFRKILPKDPVMKGSRRSFQGQIWKFSWPVSVFGIFTWLQFVSDRWALGFTATTEAVGFYSVLFQLGYYPMSIATGMAVQFLAPIYYQRAGDARDNKRTAHVHQLSRRLTKSAIGITGMAFVTGLLLHVYIFRVFVAAEYASVSYLLPWMLLGGGFFAAGQTIALNLMSQMKTLTMTTAKIITALLGIVLNFAGAYLYGIPGVVAAGVLFSLTHFTWMTILEKREKMKISA
jgi:O-antigen/teichoic acid export membrane protein